MNKIQPTVSSLITGPDEAEVGKPLAGAQTLDRGLDVLSAVARGSKTLAALSDSLGLTRSTTHRLATKLAEHRFLTFLPRVGYSLGPKLLELGYLAAQQTSVMHTAHDHLVRLSESTGDTTHMGVLDGHQVLYLDKVSGTRRIEVSSRIGERQPLRSTGIGKALLLDESEEGLGALYDREALQWPSYTVSKTEWLMRMRQYSVQECAYDLEENEDRIRCVAAPIRDVTNKIVGSISVSSAAQYMDDARMKKLSSEVKKTARDISTDLGWSEENLALRTLNSGEKRPAKAKS